MKRSIRLVCLAVAIGTMATTAVAPANASRSCPSVSPEFAELLTDTWTRAMTRADAVKLSGMYAEDAVIISPAYSKARETPTGVKQHVQKLAKRFRLVGSPKRTLRTGCNTIVDFGELQLVGRADGRKHRYAIKYSRVFERRAGYWVITLDHMTRAVPGTAPAVPHVVASARQAAYQPAAGQAVPRQARQLVRESEADRADLNRLVRYAGVRPTPRVAGMVMRYPGPGNHAVDNLIVPPRPKLALPPSVKPKRTAKPRAVKRKAALKKSTRRYRKRRAKQVRRKTAKLHWTKKLPGFGN